MLKSQQGFTLIEILVVVAMISLFLGAATIKINEAIAINNLNGAADQLAINIRTMQQLSLQKPMGSTLPINLKITETTYQINCPGMTLPIVMMPSAITMTTKIKGPLTYDPYDPTQNTGNMIILTSASAHRSKTIVICKETGRIRIDSANPTVYRAEEK